MRTPTRPVLRALLVASALLLCAAPAAAVTIEFSGTVTSITGDDTFFDVPDAGVGSAVTGVINYGTVADFIYDPIPGDCAMGYLFYEGRMTITIGRYLWDYESLAILMDDCQANDQVEFLGQSAITYPQSAPAHQLILRALDQVLPYDMLTSQDLPLNTEILDLSQATFLIGRIYSFSYGELRFSVDSIRMNDTVPNERRSWDGVKALYR